MKAKQEVFKIRRLRFVKSVNDKIVTWASRSRSVARFQTFEDFFDGVEKDTKLFYVQAAQSQSALTVKEQAIALRDGPDRALAVPD